MANEKRLIWDEDAKRRIIALATGFHTDRLPVDMVINVILHQAPTVDAVEVVHGEWEITEDDYFDLVEMKCSVCGESYGFEDYEDCIPKNYHYCPNCGAKMDGDGNA